jgi:uncharacterized protein with ParB-like and HNH nuclease domain
MKSELKSFDGFDKYFMKIPSFQRSYQWTETEWKGFWATIAERALDLTTAGNATSPIFMGALVFRELSETDDEDYSLRDFPRYAIIDGQQRMVTISVFVAALRDFYFSTESDYFRGYSEEFLFNRKSIINNKIKRRLDLQEGDWETFDLIISPKDESQWKECLKGSHQLNKLYSFFWNKLSQKSWSHLDEFSENFVLKEEVDEEEIDEESNTSDSKLINNNSEMGYLAKGSSRDWESLDLFDPAILGNIIQKDMKFAQIIIEDKDNEISFEVFETLNAKGLPLDTVSKFRNGYFMLHPQNSDEIYKKYWTPLEDKVNGKTDILETFFIEETNRKFGFTPQEKVYQKLMTDIKNSALSKSITANKINEKKRQELVVEDFKDLIHSLNAFLIVHSGVDDLQGKTEDGIQYGLLLDSLKKMISGPATPLLMDVVKWSHNLRTSKEIQLGVNKILRSVQNLLARRLLTGIKPQQLRSLLSNVPREINKYIRDFDSKMECTPDNLDHYNNKLNKMMIQWGPERYPTDEMLLSNPLRDVYNSTGKKLALFSVLWELERVQNKEFRNQKIPQVSKSSGAWSIEHVLPQGMKSENGNLPTMNLEWKEDWKKWDVKDIDINFLKSVHSLGNLTILTNGSNSSLGNKAFSIKKSEYKKQSRTYLVDDILEESEWSPSEIEKRSIKMLNNAIKIWPYPELN